MNLISHLVHGTGTTTVKIETSANVFELWEVPTDTGDNIFGFVKSNLSLTDYDSNDNVDTTPNISLINQISNMALALSSIALNAQ